MMLMRGLLKTVSMCAGDLGQIKLTTYNICKASKQCQLSYLTLNGVRNAHISSDNDKTSKIKEKMNETKIKLRETKVKLQETKVKLKETKVIVTQKMDDMRENIKTIPNALCVARILSTPFLGYMVMQEMYLPAVGLFTIAGITDMLDGYIARNYPNQKSKFGSFLDPAADKFLVATLFVTLTYTGLIPIPLTALIITRDACLLTSGFYIRYLSLPEPKTFFRYFNATLATASMSPTLVSKFNTAIQLCLVGASLGAPVFHYVHHPYLHYLWYFTALTTVASGISYIFTKDTYKIISEARAAKKN